MTKYKFARIDSRNIAMLKSYPTKTGGEGWKHAFYCGNSIVSIVSALEHMVGENWEPPDGSLAEQIADLKQYTESLRTELRQVAANIVEINRSA